MAVVRESTEGIWNCLLAIGSEEVRGVEKAAAGLVSATATDEGLVSATEVGFISGSCFLMKLSLSIWRL